MASTRSAGISGSAVLIATAGLYLVYAGVKDVPLVDGLRDLLRKKTPTPRTTHADYSGTTTDGIGKGMGFLAGGGVTGELGLVGNAARALPTFKAMFPGMTMYGRGERPDTPSSDHPKGLAIDLMTGDNATAQTIIKRFKAMPGAKYWIWNRKKADIRTLWLMGPYTGSNPHTDHVHLSFM